MVISYKRLSGSEYMVKVWGMALVSRWQMVGKYMVTGRGNSGIKPQVIA